MNVSARRVEVIRVFERYLVEVVERWDLCPWARPARERGELAVEVLWGAPSAEAFSDASIELLARPATRVAMVIAPELVVTPSELRSIRDLVSARVPSAGIAHFHPDAPLDLATPPRLVPYLRRSPDPLLQLVPLSVLDGVRAAPPPLDLAEQAAILSGRSMPPPRLSASDRLAIENHATVTGAHAEVTRVLVDIAADRAAAYRRVGISASR